MRFLICLFFTGPFMFLGAQTPPPPALLQLHRTPPQPPHLSSSENSISVKCSRFLNVEDQVKIMTMGKPLNLFFIPMLTACEDIVCAKMYNASCNPQQCPKCKLYTGSAKRFQAQVEDSMGNNVGVSCNTKQMYTIYQLTCVAENDLANITSRYVLRIYALQPNGTISRLDNMATIVFEAGDISIVDSGPGYWPNGNDFAVGVVSSFMFPVKDKYNNVKRRSSGAATVAELGQFNLMFSSIVKSVRLKYDTETGYVNITFVPTKLGVSKLSVGRIGNGIILGSPYTFNVVISGPISSQNCLAVWSSNQNIIMAGNEAYVTIVLKDSYNNAVDISTGWSDTKNFSLTLIDTVGNRCQNCAILTSLPGAGYETAVINVTMPGYYKLNISDGDKLVSGSPVNFTVIAGTISAKNCIASWLNNINSISAGDMAVLRVLLMDAYGNNISDATGRKVLYRFNVFSNNTLNMVTYANFNMSFDTVPGYERISFVPSTVGRFSLYVSYEGEDVSGSPYNFTVTPGSVSIPHCQGFWLYNISTFTAGQRATLQVFMLDEYDNAITSASQTFNFSATVLDMNEQTIFVNIQQTYDGDCSCQVISFNTSTSGDFLFQISEGKMFINASPFFFHVDPGDIHPSSCDGFWPDNINTFIVSSVSAFSVIYRDLYNNTLNASSIPSVNVSATIMNESGLGRNSILNISRISAYVNIYFTSFSSGSMLLHVMVNEIEITGSPYSFEMLPGLVDASNCKGSWHSVNSEFQAGSYPTFIVYLMDAFNNTVIPKFLQSNYLDVNAYAKTDGGGVVDLYNLTSVLDNGAGYETLQFLTTTVGNFSLYVQYNATDIDGSPFPYSVIPGPISVEHSLGFLGSQSGNYMVSENITIYILLQDAYGNNITALMESGTYVDFSIELNSTKHESYSPSDVSLSVQNDSGYEVITFSSLKAGQYFIYVMNGSASIETTLTVSINPGNFLCTFTRVGAIGVNLKFHYTFTRVGGPYL